MKQKIEIITSDDGSSTIFLPELNETYHSTNGAVQESEHVFIKSGLSFLAEKQQEITILEIGFGTGLNALLTALFAEKNNIKITYHTLEPYPLNEEIVSQLNHGECIKEENANKYFQELHSCNWEEKNKLHKNFDFYKYLQKLEDFSIIENKFDLVYFDAFAPNRQAEMWTIEQLGKVAEMMKENSVLVTYCAKGQFKRDLKSLNFELEMLAGPPGKREMTRAFYHK